MASTMTPDPPQRVGALRRRREWYVQGSHLVTEQPGCSLDHTAWHGAVLPSSRDDGFAPLRSSSNCASSTRTSSGSNATRLTSSSSSVERAFRLADPMFATTPSTVMIFACSIDGWNCQILTPHSSNLSKEDSPASWTNRLSICGPGSRIWTSTPRSAARADTVVELRIRDEVGGRDPDPLLCELQESKRTTSRCRSTRSPTPLGPTGRPSSRLRLVGEPVDLRFGTERRPSRAQLSRKAARSPSTAGPRTRKCVSRHSCSFRASPFHSSAIPTPPGETHRLVDDQDLPVGPVVRLVQLEPGERTEPADNCTPASPIIVTHDVSIACAPHPSRSTRTRTPCPRPLGERLGETRPDLPLPIHEGQQVDRPTGAADVLEHRREDLVARCAISRRGSPRSPARRWSPSSARRSSRRLVAASSPELGRWARRSRRSLPTGGVAVGAAGSRLRLEHLPCTVGVRHPARTASSCAARAAPDQHASAGRTTRTPAR